MIEDPDVRTGPDAAGAVPELSALLDDAAVDAAVRARRVAREGRDRARELATWVGALRDLAERTATVQVHTAADVACTGDLVSVAADHVVLRLHGGGFTVVARAAITGLRVVAPDTPAGAAAGARPAPSDQALLTVLDRWREDGAPVHLVTRGGDGERGRFVTVGEDVISLATSAGTLHVPADAIVSVTVR
jgi:hypothetical protein